MLIRNEKINEVLMSFLSPVEKNEFFSFILARINIEETSTIPTCAVALNDKMQLSFLYNPEFINSLPTPQVKFIIIHEIYHILYQHLMRINGRDKYVSNIAQDWIINFNIIKDFVNSKADFKVPVEIPKDSEGKNMGAFMTKEYQDEHVYEIVYNFLMKEKEKMVYYLFELLSIAKASRFSVLVSRTLVQWL